MIDNLEAKEEIGKEKDWFLKILIWREKNIKEKNFILILSFLVGMFAAFAALILKYLIHFIQNLLTEHFTIDGANYLYLVYPIIGILLSGMYVRYVVKDDISHGVTRILYAISQRKSRLKPHNMYTSVVASSITIGFGGSVGAEAPVVYTGAAIGSNIGRLFRLDQRVLMLMVGCGAAAGIAGIFKAPIAGLLFTLEVLMIDLTTTSVMPLLISSTTAAVVTYIFMGPTAQFSFVQTEPFIAERIPYVILLGIFCGFISLYFTRIINWLEDIFRKLSKPWLKFGFGAVILSLTIFLLPPLYGEGYDSIIKLLGGNVQSITDGSIFYPLKDNFWILFLNLGLIVLLKVFATAATNGGGGVGGTFAPSLYLGCMSGFLFAFTLNHFGYSIPLSEKNFALMGMAGVMSGVMHAPLMGIFLTAELTGGFSLFLPLMITSTVAFGTIKIFEPYSIYTMRLAKKGELLTHHKDKAVLTLLKMDSVIEKDFLSVRPDMNLGDMVKIISNAHRNIFPVIDSNNILLGIVLLDDIRNIMFRPELYNRFYVRRFMVSPPAKIVVGMPMEKVMKIFDDTNAWNLPVVEEDGKYVGFVSKSKIFNSYRRVLVHFSQD
ncbi:chloride channel protein [Coprobacter tertius]|uniref:Chloride channel protein n=1 Tax=Coprobacter tertius TaxID=2944915 RepID=A0ABT1MGQ0_9BACT|nr:chloride channel protein [Coprobacter tertius]MCP9611021.1 chloride channel protein [Coprobacter tertius]